MLHYYFVNGDCYGWIPRWNKYVRFVSFAEFVEVLEMES